DELVIEDEAVHRRTVLTTPFLRPGERDPSAFAELADELSTRCRDALLALSLAHRILRQLGGEEVADLLAEAPFVVRDGEIHPGSPARLRRAPSPPGRPRPPIGFLRMRKISSESTRGPRRSSRAAPASPRVPQEGGAHPDDAARAGRRRRSRGRRSGARRHPG